MDQNKKADGGRVSPQHLKTEDMEIPTHIAARYKIGESIGEGGNAIVKAAVSSADNSKVAIKICNRKNLSPLEEAYLRQEADMLQHFKHPNIVQAFDFFEDKKGFFLVMERVDGGELFDRIIRKQHYTEKEARDLAQTLLHALKYIHDKNIIHR